MSERRLTGRGTTISTKDTAQFGFSEHFLLVLDDDARIVRDQSEEALKKVTRAESDAGHQCPSTAVGDLLHGPRSKKLHRQAIGTVIVRGHGEMFAEQAQGTPILNVEILHPGQFTAAGRQDDFVRACQDVRVGDLGERLLPRIQRTEKVRMQALLVERRSTGKEQTGRVCCQCAVIARTEGDQSTNETTSIWPEAKCKAR